MKPRGKTSSRPPLESVLCKLELVKERTIHQVFLEPRAQSVFICLSLTPNSLDLLTLRPGTFDLLTLRPGVIGVHTHVHSVQSVFMVMDFSSHPRSVLCL